MKKNAKMGAVTMGVIFAGLCVISGCGGPAGKGPRDPTNATPLAERIDDGKARSSNVDDLGGTSTPSIKQRGPTRDRSAHSKTK